MDGWITWESLTWVSEKGEGGRGRGEEEREKEFGWFVGLIFDI